MPRAESRQKRCAIYTRKSSEEGLEQEFNSLAAQREACEAYIRSQCHEGWVLARTRYDDGVSWQGMHYRSLTAIARKITGTAWSGPLFFGLRSNRSATHLPSQGSVPVTRPMEEDRGDAG